MRKSASMLCLLRLLDLFLTDLRLRTVLNADPGDVASFCQVIRRQQLFFSEGCTVDETAYYPSSRHLKTVKVTLRKVACALNSVIISRCNCSMRHTAFLSMTALHQACLWD